MLREFLGMNSRATIENPQVSLNDPATWDSMFNAGMTSSSGVKVSHRGALKLGAVWQAVSLISGDIAKLPLNVYQREDERSREKDKTHPAHRLVRRKANRELSAFRFWRRVMVHALLWNRAYIYIARDMSGRPTELISLLPDRTAIERKKGRLQYVTETTTPDGNPWLREIDAENVMHIEGPNIDDAEPCDLIEYAREAFGLGLAAQGFASRFFKHGVRAGGILQLPPGLGEKARNNVEEGFKKYHEGQENWFRTVILRDGAKFHQNSIAPNEGQMAETREELVRDVARYFNLQPSRLGLQDSVSYNSKAEDNQAYLDSTLSPWLCGITSESDCKLLTDEQQSAGSHYFEHNTASLLRMNTVQRYQVYAIAKRNRILTTNEIRAMENLNPVEDGDQFDDFPSSGGIGSSDGGADKQPADGEGTDKGKTESSGRNLPLTRMVFRMTDHARRKSEKSSAFIEWIDGNLPSHREAAKALECEIIVEEFRKRLAEVAESTPEALLASAVEAVCEEFERAN